MSPAEIKQEHPAVRMVGLASGRVRLEDWKSRRKVLDLTYHVCRHQISGDEIALRIDIGIDSVNDTKLAHQDFNRHVMGGRSESGSSVAIWFFYGLLQPVGTAKKDEVEGDQ